MKTAPIHAVAKGRIWHRRQVPFGHRFQYPLWLLWCDLSRLDKLLEQHWAWGRRWRPVTVRNRDFIDHSEQPLDEKARAKAVELGLDWQSGRVFLLGQARTLGTLFNPLVLYVHLPEGGDSPDSMLAEVQNTPWKETHFYPISLREQDGQWVHEHDKTFHVSPFLPLALRYHWHLHTTFPDWRLTLEDRDGDTTVFQAGLNVTLDPATSHNMGMALWRFGAQGLVTLARIYWQAFRLWRKGARFYAHPGDKH